MSHHMSHVTCLSSVLSVPLDTFDSFDSDIDTDPVTDTDTVILRLLQLKASWKRN